MLLLRAATIHKFVRDIYATKLQELEQLVQNPLDYAKVIKIIGNETVAPAPSDTRTQHLVCVGVCGVCACAFLCARVCMHVCVGVCRT